jgi:serine/threonine protein kinase
MGEEKTEEIRMVERDIRKKMSNAMVNDGTKRYDRRKPHRALHTMQNWCTPDPGFMGGGSVYTTVRSTGNGYEILIPKISSSSPGDVWNPFDPKNGRPVDSIPPGGLLIGSKRGNSAYRITGILGKGEYGVVFRARNVDPSTMADADENMALKFMLIKSKDLIESQQHGQPERIGMDVNRKQRSLLVPRSTHGLFLHYIMQMSYAGCIPDTMPVHNVFFFASPDGVDGSVQWCMVIATELMDGNIEDILSSHKFREMGTRERLENALEISCKMTRAVHNLETHGIFNDDIKLQNFLCSNTEDRGCIIKVMDFDLGFIANRMLKVSDDNDRLSMQVVMDYARNNPNGEGDAPWVNDPGTRYITRPSKCSHFQPPEYDITSTIIKRMEGMGSSKFATAIGNDPSSLHHLVVSTDIHVPTGETRSNDSDILKFRMKSVYNADWLSRMIAFELTCTIREIFILAGLSPHYDPSTGEYPSDMRPNTGPKKSIKRCACSLVRMMPDGDDNIYPPEPAYDTPEGLIGWRMLRNNTVDPKNIDPKYIDDVKELNDMIARVIAPMDTPNPTTHLPMRSIQTVNSNELLCSNIDMSNRPTTGELLRFMVKIARRCNVRMNMEGSPLSTRETLNTNVIAIY